MPQRHADQAHPRKFLHRRLPSTGLPSIVINPSTLLVLACSVCVVPSELVCDLYGLESHKRHTSLICQSRYYRYLDSV